MPPCSADAVLILHGVRGAFEIFTAKRDGTPMPLQQPTKIETHDILSLLNIPGLEEAYPSAFHDPKEGRWVMLFTSFASAGVDRRPPLVVAVSQSSNPLDAWTMWALDGSVQVAPGIPFCIDRPHSDFMAEYPQVNYAFAFAQVLMQFHLNTSLE